jgi:hypothetical protein
MKETITLDFLWGLDLSAQTDTELRVQRIRGLCRAETVLLEWMQDDRQLPAHLKNADGPALWANGHPLPDLTDPGITDQQFAERISRLARTTDRRKRGLRRRSATTFLLNLGIALFPKCPVCWASYMSVLVSAGLPEIPYYPWLLWVMAGLLLVNLLLLFRLAKRRSNYAPVLVTMAGSALVGLGTWVFGSQWVTIPGFVLVFVGALLNALPAGMQQTVVHYLRFGGLFRKSASA